MNDTQRKELEALMQKMGMRRDTNSAQRINDQTHAAYHRHNGADAPCTRKH